MKRKFLINSFLFPISLLSVVFLQLNISNLISPSAVHATNWNAYDVSKKSGLRNLKNGNYQKAVEFFTKAINIYNRDSDSYYFRGEANQGLGNHNEAIADFKKSMTMDGIGYKANTNYMIGYSYIQLEDFDNALIHLNKAISIKSDKGGYYYSRGYVYLNQEKWDEALKDYEVAKVKYLKKKEKLDEYFYSEIGYVHYNLGSLKLAIDNYDKAIEINPKEGFFYSDKGDALYDLGKEDDACANYIKSSELGYEEIKDYLNSSDGDWCKK